MPDKPTYEELVTKIEELESTARKNQEFFRKIFDLIPSCIIIKDRNGKFVLANKKTASFYGPNVEEVTGKRLVKEILNIRADMPIILCTGYHEKISEEKAMELGIKAFVTKPFVTHDFALTVRKVLIEARNDNEKPH